MKLRTHISPVVCLVVVLASLSLGSVALAQQALFQAPFGMPPARQSFLSDRFYIQAGAQFRNIQRFGFKKSPAVIRYEAQVGVPPFGPTETMVQATNGDFGTGTGVPGYQEFGMPTGDATQDPRLSGIWTYDNGRINPNGDLAGNVWPVDWINPANTLAGLGMYRTGSDAYNLGWFSVASTAGQVDTGFDPANPPAKNTSINITWQRIMDDSVAVAPEHGTPSIIWLAWGQELPDREYNEQIWGPTFELGFQWTNLFDLFYGLSWFDLDKSLAWSYATQADLWRRGFRDRFSFYSDDTTNWLPGPWISDIVPAGSSSVNQQINPDSRGPGGYPNRTFFEQIDPTGTASQPPVTLTEDLTCSTSARVYEHRVGARSWTPLYGLGRFGVTAGPLVNAIYYRASQLYSTTFTQEGQVLYTATTPTSREEWLVSFGLFVGADVELTFNRFFVKTNAQYSISEEKQIENSGIVQTNLNPSGFSSIFVGGLRF